MARSRDGDPGSARARKVVRDIRSRGVTDPHVLDAMGEVPRERFVSDQLAQYAYDDNPLPIEEGQTISQPYIVALMAEAAELDADARVLEVGAGSGYGAAVLGRIAAEVWSIERHERLAEIARQRTSDLGEGNVHIVCGDGSLGWPEAAPFDAIVVTAAAATVPKALEEQLAEGGRLVIPVGPSINGQDLLRFRKIDGQLVREYLGAVRFVPLISDRPR
jgi:protein-L-isoaspartate(D-aspartate) O-methyltransferase